MEKRDLITRLLRTRPLFICAAFFLLGCAAEYAFGFSRLSLYFALVPLLLLICLCKMAFPEKRRFIPALLVIAMLPMGAIRFEIQWSSLSPLPEQEKAQLSGRISQFPQWEPEDERTICVLDNLSIDGLEVHGKLRLYLRGDVEALQQLTLGQEVRCTAHIWQDTGATNPGQFDFSNYLRLNGLLGYATAKIDDTVLSTPTLCLKDYREILLFKLGQRVERLFPQNSALAKAFLLGDRSDLSDVERENFSRSGAAHLLAISGMHVSVLAAAVSLLLGCFLNRKWAYGVSLALLIGYGTLIGFSASLFRAVLMFAIFGGAPLLGRYSDSLTRLSAAMLAYLLVRPIGAIEAGFLLSYGACAGIILLSPPLQRLFHVQNFLKVHPGSGVRAWLKHRLPRWCIQMLIMTTAAQLSILPIVVHFFGAQPALSLVINLVAVPLAMAGYLLAIAGMVTGFSCIAAVSDALFGCLNGCVAFFNNLPLVSLPIARFPIWLCAICAILCLASSDLSRLPEKWRRYLPLGIILAALLSNVVAHTTTLGCSIVFLDCGQADCAVIRTQGKVYLIDTGDSYSPAPDYLSAMNYQLEGVFLSHAHADHSGGLEGILDVTVPKRIYISSQWQNDEMDPAIVQALDRAQSLGSEIIVLTAGDKIQLSSKTFLSVLSPTAGFSPNSANEDSMVLRVDWGQTSALFCGDAPADKLGGLAVDIDLLKTPHHGARDALSAALLSELSPSVAVIPVGVNNYGHPAGETLDMLDAANAQICRLDQTGALVCHLYEDGTVLLRPYRNLENAYGLE